MITSVNETVTDLTGYIAAILSKNDLPFNEYVLQMIIYKIKMELGDDHPIYDKIPYYWYCHGPFSEVVKKSYRHLKAYCTHVKDDKIAIKPEHIPNYQKNKITNKFSEIEAINYTIIYKRNYIYSNLAEDIYKDYAPCKFIYPYKYKVFNLSESEKLAIDGEEFLKLVKHCDSLLPWDDFELKYDIIFSNFVSAIDFFNDNDLIANYWSDIKQALRNLWFTYAKGMRIQKHDFYYDDKKQLWNRIYLQSLDKTGDTVQTLLDNSLNTVDFNYPPEYTPRQKKFLNTLAEAYLRDD